MNRLRIIQSGDLDISEGIDEFVVYSLDEQDKYNPPIAIFKSLHEAVDWCYDEGLDFDVKTHAQAFREEQFGGE